MRAVALKGSAVFAWCPTLGDVVAEQLGFPVRIPLHFVDRIERGKRSVGRPGCKDGRVFA